LNKHNAFSFLAAIRRFAGFLVQYEIWPVTLLIAASFVWLSLLPAAVITAAVFLFLRWIATGRITKRTPADGGVILLLVMVPVTLWATALPAITIPQVYRLLTGMVFYYAIVNWCSSPKRLRFLLLGTTLAGSFLAIFAAVSVQWPIGKLAFISGQLYQQFSVLVSDTVHPNVMAGSLILLLPVPLAGLFFAWGKMGWPERIIHSEAVLVILGMLALTQSRGAWMALGAVILSLIILRWRRGWLIFVPVIVLALIAINQLGIPRIIEIAFSGGAISGWDGRREIWSRAIYMIQDFPFTGIGMGSFGKVADALYPFFSYSPGAIPHAHNLFLQIAVDLGIPGLIAWLSILLVVIALAWKLFRQGRIRQNVQCAALGAGLLCSQIALVVHGMTDAVTWGMVRPAPLVWAVWGLAVAGWYVYIHPENNPLPNDAPNKAGPELPTNEPYSGFDL
jgi:putative inorganic carbon (HCO3(-)) transporter